MYQKGFVFDGMMPKLLSKFAPTSSGTMLCQYFFGEKGRYGCQAGSSCKFSHERADSAYLEGQSKQSIQKQVTSVVHNSAGPSSIKALCRFISSNRTCQAGDECPFKHSEYEADERERRVRVKKRREGGVIKLPLAPPLPQPRPNIGPQNVGTPLKKSNEQEEWALPGDESKNDAYFYGATSSSSNLLNHNHNWSNVVGQEAFANVAAELDSNFDSLKYKSGPLSIPVFCRFHVDGGCSAQENCPFMHSNNIQQEEKRRFAWLLKQPTQTQTTTTTTTTTTTATHESEICGICLEPITEKRFGILSCPHPFCLDCIRNWRAEEGNVLTKACPICRVQSHFIIPSVKFVCETQAKKKLISEYLDSTSRMPCKFFNGEELGSCPFGTSCHFLHFDRRTGKTLERGEGVALRFIIDEDGVTKGIEKVLLCEFLEGQL